MVEHSDFWRGKRVFITGHTGFKGGWLALYLHRLGAEIKGYALPAPTTPSLFQVADVASVLQHVEGDIRDLTCVMTEMQIFQPEFVFHLAAQPLVRYSYQQPVETYATNVMGTVNLLEAVRHTSSVKSVVIVTSDKCYENKEWLWGYRENEPMGGFDPYSNSKGCSELVTASYRNSFFPSERYAEHGVAVASVRAGNVIGGGDWAQDRLIPDIMKAFMVGEAVTVRNPTAIRPWQHVLEPVTGYVLLAEQLYKKGSRYAEGWNFGPSEADAQPVSWILEKLADLWGNGASWQIDGSEQPHEAHYLKLDCSKAKTLLGWGPRWTLAQALAMIVDWNLAYQQGKDMRQVCAEQLEQFLASEQH
ncbi:CDP-glucose 4,6-dehydratase [Methylomonas sp. EbA]|uniref:CDP-glucose 4,6-dehydratase n=2 Tax=Methylomonas albis TaxID=1854563 RepID=A0ABR9D0T1_9GAMM|nr:CDP-glucose 4,6-dehydratase [Methylomonas albis]